METAEEIGERVEQYRNRAAQYFRNSEEAASKEEYEKAGELLWGAVANYLHAFTLLREKKTYRRHRAIVNYGIQIAKQKGDKRLVRAVEEVDEMHEHYYQGTRIRSTFPDRLDDARYALGVLDKMLGEEVRLWLKLNRPSSGGESDRPSS